MEIIHMDKQEDNDYVSKKYNVDSKYLQYPFYLVNSNLMISNSTIELTRILCNSIPNCKLIDKTTWTYPVKNDNIEMKETTLVNVRVKYIRPKYKDLREWTADPNNVYIARGGVVFIDGKRFPEKDSLLCNKFKVGKTGRLHEVIYMFRDWLMEKIKNGEITKEYILSLEGKTLGCWCVSKPTVYDETQTIKDYVCHGQVLLELIETLKNTK